VLGLRSGQACSACGERPPRDLSIGVRNRRRRLRVAGVSGDSRRAVLRCGAAWPSGARAGLLCITACLHLNPSMALTSALAYSFRLHEAAAVVESGGDAGAEWRPVGDPQREPCVGHV